MAKRVDRGSDEEFDDPSDAQMKALRERFSGGDRSRLEGGTEKIRRGRSDQDEEGGSSRRDHRKGRRPPISTPWVPEPESHPVVIPSAPVEKHRSPTPERTVQPMTQQQTQVPTGQRTPDPFSQALNLAGQINTERPREDQPEIYAELMAAIGQLNEGQRKGLTNRVRDAALQDDHYPIQGLFPVAQAARLFSVAPNTAAIKKAKRADDLSVVDLIKFGLGAMVYNDKADRAFFNGRVRLEDIEAAIPLLRDAGKTKAADSLKMYLNDQELRRLAHETERAHRAKKATASAQATAEAATTAPAVAVEAPTAPEATEEPTETPATTATPVTSPEASTPTKKPGTTRTRKPKPEAEASS